MFWPESVALRKNEYQIRFDKEQRPVHLDIHGGAFIGGNPEANHRFCSAIAEGTGAIVVSASYRFAPKHPFPAAIDDIDDIVDWLLEYAESELGGDPTCLTIGGTSAGGNLALAACMKERSVKDRIKAVVTAYAAVRVRLRVDRTNMVRLMSLLRRGKSPSPQTFRSMIPFGGCCLCMMLTGHPHDLSITKIPERVLYMHLRTSCPAKY